MTRFRPAQVINHNYFTRKVEAERKVNILLEIIGRDFAEIQEPEGGWSNIHKACVLRNSGKFGKFFIKKGALIDYMHKDYIIINLQNYHSSLMELAIKQLEDTCHILIGYRTQFSKFPNLAHLITKYYGLY